MGSIVSTIGRAAGVAVIAVAALPTAPALGAQEAVVAPPSVQTSYPRVTATSRLIDGPSAAPAKRIPGRTIKVVVTGLPRGARGHVIVRGPDKFKQKVASSRLLRNLEAGTYRITARATSTVNGTAFATVRPSRAKVTRTRGAKVTVTYRTGKPTPTPTPTPTPAPTPTPTLRFNLSGAVGVALASTAARQALPGRTLRASTDVIASSGLVAIDQAGNATDAVASGSATVSRFLIAPNDTLYVLFSTPTPLAGGPSCLLARVDRATGVPTCIDSGLQQITWPFDAAKQNPALQFDDSGAIYYLGSTSDGRTVLRRNRDGVATDLINDSIVINDFLVLGDGSVIISGKSTATNADWIRRVTPQGGLQTLVSSLPSQFLRVFPDGNVYMGVWGTGNFGVRRFLTATNSVDGKYWISASINAELNPDTQFLASEWCPAPNGVYYQSFCGWFGSMIRGSFRTTDSKQFMIAGSGAEGLAMEYYPTVRVLPTSVTKVSVAQGVLTNLILAGLNASNQNVLTLFNTSTDSETELIGASNEVEIYHVNYVAATNTIMFDGLRFADNEYVIGQVNMNTLQVAMAQTGSTRMVDFQTF